MAEARGGTGFTHEAPNDGKTVEWYTPAWVFEMLGLRFNLDPCAPAGGLPWIPADRFISLPSDGLAEPWHAGELVFCNPPYGPATKKWLQRMSDHANGIALVFARTDTEWFHQHAVNADAVLLLKGRVQFVDETGNPPKKWNAKKQKWEDTGPGTGSMLLAWGGKSARALLNARHRGLLIDLQTNAKVIELRSKR